MVILYLKTAIFLHKSPNLFLLNMPKSHHYSLFDLYGDTMTDWPSGANRNIFSHIQHIAVELKKRSVHSFNISIISK